MQHLKHALVKESNDEPSIQVWFELVYTTYSKEVYIIFVLAILTPYSYFERDGNCMKLSQHSQWTCRNTPTNFQDDVTVILENRKIRVFQKC